MQDANLTKLKGEIDKFAIIVGSVSTSLSMTDRPSRFLKISKNTENMNTTNQCNLITIYRTQWPKMAEHALKCPWNILQNRQPPGP